jgi:hypothetical protein
MAVNASAAATTGRGKTVKAPANGRTEPARPDGAPTEEMIRARAFALWEEAGRPECDGVDFWLRAEQELTAAR